ncbi:MAG: SCO family protein [Pseudomonadota bacterium]
MQRIMIGAGLGVAVIAVAAAAGLAMGLFDRTDAPLGPSAVNVEGSDLGGPFAMETHDGRRVTDATLIDGPTLIYFGYTYCPDVCPFDVQHMAEATDMLADQGVEVKPVFVTVDPERDTPEQLGYFVEAMHPRMIGLRGSEEELKAAADAYRVYYKRVRDPEDPDAYLMNHTAFTYFMMPDGIAGLFRNGYPPEETVREVMRVLEARGLAG